MKTAKYIESLDKVSFIDRQERERLKPITERFGFRANEYYLNLINWEDPCDPIRRIVIPDPEEVTDWGRWDASQENKYTIIPGLQHKYYSVALILASNICGGYCRFCFRKRLFFKSSMDALNNFSEILSYLRAHSEITDVLLSGGDPLLLSTRKLDKIISRIRSIDHIKILRIGSKIPAYNPYRILNDPSLLELFRQYSKPVKRIYFMTNFNHPRELTEPAIKAIALLHKANLIMTNQTPLLKGINSDPFVLSELFKKLSFIGVPPYYVFQCRPTLGNKPYAVPVEEAYEIFEQARINCSGLAKRARFVMSHSTGKIEVVGNTEHQIYFKYHSSANSQDGYNLLIFERNPYAYWFDDYEEKKSALPQKFLNQVS